MAVTDYHANIRDAIRDALKGTDLLNCDVKTIDGPDDAKELSKPVVAVCCVGPEQDVPSWTTNAQDGRGFPVMVALFATGTTRGEKDQGPPSATNFRRIVHTTFNNKRLSGVAEVGYCEVHDSGPIYDEKSPAFQQLVTALVVVAKGRFPRG